MGIPSKRLVGYIYWQRKYSKTYPSKLTFITDKTKIVHTKDYIGKKFCSSKLKFAARNIFNLHLWPRTTRASPILQCKAYINIHQDGLFRKPPPRKLCAGLSKKTRRNFCSSCGEAMIVNIDHLRKKAWPWVLVIKRQCTEQKSKMKTS